MTGQAMKSFLDFEIGTGALHTTSPDDIINAGAAYQRYIWPSIYRNNKAKAAQGGDEIDFPVVFEDNGTYENRLPGQWHDWKNPNRLKRGVLDWRFSLVHKAWNEKEITMNDKVRYGTASARFDQFVRISSEKELLMQTAACNGIENDLWRQPNVGTMETANNDGKQPYSIWAHVNEDTDGLWGKTGALATGGTAFTEKQRLVPSDTNYTQGRYKPQRATYANLTQDSPGNIIAGMEELYDMCMFKPPESMEKYFNDPSMNNLKILVGKKFRKAYRSLIRGGQDRFSAGPQDPAVTDPLFQGIPVQWAPAMDTAAVYWDGAGTALTDYTTEFLADITGPRALFLNFNFLFMVFYQGEDGGFMDRKEPSHHHNQFDDWVVPIEITWNMLCQKYNVQGILSPSADIAIF